VVSIVSLSPSGPILENGSDGRGIEHSNGFGGGGLLFSYPFEVLFINCKELGVFFLSFF
jgi:hypothetical protein